MQRNISDLKLIPLSDLLKPEHMECKKAHTRSILEMVSPYNASRLYTGIKTATRDTKTPSDDSYKNIISTLLLEDQHIYYLYQSSKERLCGEVSIGFAYNDTTGQCETHSSDIICEPLRGKGYGKALLALYILKAQEIGADVMNLDVEPENFTALNRIRALRDADLVSELPSDTGDLRRFVLECTHASNTIFSALNLTNTPHVPNEQSSAKPMNC